MHLAPLINLPDFKDFLSKNRVTLPRLRLFAFRVMVSAADDHVRREAISEKL